MKKASQSISYTRPFNSNRTVRDPKTKRLVRSPNRSPVRKPSPQKNDRSSRLGVRNVPND